MSDIPTMIQFIQQTKPDKGSLKGKFKRRGSNMRKVDKALQHWWDNQTTPNTEDKITLLYILAKECKRWLSKKKSKKITPLFLKRRSVIEELGKRAIERIGLLDPETGAAYHKFELRKRSLGPHGHLHGLSSGYSLEREYYLKTGKHHALSGSELTNITISHAQANKSHASKKLKKLVAKKTFEQMSLSEFESLGVFGGNVEVTYLNKIRRLRHWAMIENWKFVDIHGAKINMVIRDNKGKRYFYPQPYAMDQYGNVFVVEDYDNTGYKQQWFNHSSFMAGREVICAGGILICGGELLSIDNDSGHYKPPTEQLLECVTFLRDEEEVDVTKCRVCDFSGGPVPKEFHAETFITSKGKGTADWKLEDDIKVGLCDP